MMFHAIGVAFLAPSTGQQSTAHVNGCSLQADGRCSPTKWITSPRYVRQERTQLITSSLPAANAIEGDCESVWHERLDQG